VVALLHRYAVVAEWLVLPILIIVAFKVDDSVAIHDMILNMIQDFILSGRIVRKQNHWWIIKMPREAFHSLESQLTLTLVLVICDLNLDA
jgi:hypothetical protein